MRKIAVLKAGAIGDVLVTLPAVHAIRYAYPHAELILLGNSTAIELLGSGRSPIDRCIPLPPIRDLVPGGRINWEHCTGFIRLMQEEGLDIVVNFQGRGKTANPFISSFRTGITVSFEGRDTSPVDRSIPYLYFQSESIRYQELVMEIGAEYQGAEATLALLPADLERAAAILTDAGLEQYLIINPLSNDIRRSWPMENYIPIIRELNAYDQNIILTGSEDQHDELERLNEQCGGICFNAGGMTDLPTLAALIQDAGFLIAPDTGPLHLARAVGTPTIGLYWAPNLINWGPLTRKKHIPIISWEMACPLCGTTPIDPFPFEPQDTCTHQISFIRNIRPEQVLEQIAQFLFTPVKYT